MIRHVPDFILPQYAEWQLSDSFEGFGLLFDVADFRPIDMQFQ